MTHKTHPGENLTPPLAPYWYSETEAMAYREGYMLAANTEYLRGYRTGRESVRPKEGEPG